MTWRARLAGGFRAQDDAHALGEAELLNDRAEAGAFLGIFDLAGDAAGVVLGHEHQETAGEGDVGGDARPLVADRALGDLHEDFRTHRVEVRDVLGSDHLLLGTPTAGLSATADLLHALHIERFRDGVPEVQEGILLQTDVHEHGLEALLDVLDAALVDAADKMSGADTLDGKLLEHSVLQQGDAVFKPFAIDDDACSLGDVLVACEEFFDLTDTVFHEFQCHMLEKLLRLRLDARVALRLAEQIPAGIPPGGWVACS